MIRKCYTHNDRYYTPFFKKTQALIFREKIPSGKRWAAGPSVVSILPGQRETGGGYTPKIPNISRPKRANQPAGQLFNSGKILCKEQNFSAVGARLLALDKLYHTLEVSGRGVWGRGQSAPQQGDL